MSLSEVSEVRCLIRGWSGAIVHGVQSTNRTKLNASFPPPPFIRMDYVNNNYVYICANALPATSTQNRKEKDKGDEGEGKNEEVNNANRLISNV